MGARLMRIAREVILEQLLKSKLVVIDRWRSVGRTFLLTYSLSTCPFVRQKYLYSRVCGSRISLIKDYC